jgi:hypothetical protein
MQAGDGDYGPDIIPAHGLHAAGEAIDLMAQRFKVSRNTFERYVFVHFLRIMRSPPNPGARSRTLAGIGTGAALAASMTLKISVMSMYS